jgi:L-ascorbate metabolism protein UlaG (beta-lactamase superfamily)
MGVQDAIKAAGYVGVNKILGVHYDTFGFIKIDHAKAIEDFTKAGKRLYLQNIGSEIEL